MTGLQHEGSVVNLPTRSLEDDFPNLLTHRESVTRVIVVPPEPTRVQRMAIIEASGSLEFWDDPAEDVYSQDDGDPA